MEAVGFVYPIYDKLKMLNDCTVSVASPSRLIAKSKLKNDRIDAIALGELLRINYLPHIIDEQARSRLPWRGQGMQGEKQGLLLK
jgi:hypothetical protein